MNNEKNIVNINPIFENMAPGVCVHARPASLFHIYLPLLVPVRAFLVLERCAAATAGEEQSGTGGAGLGPRGATIACMVRPTHRQRSPGLVALSTSITLITLILRSVLSSVACSLRTAVHEP
jgi:hypothetical protein